MQNVEMKWEEFPDTTLFNKVRDSLKVSRVGHSLFIQLIFMENHP